MLLHSGLDVLYVDMDTFLLADPIPHVLAQAAATEADALFAQHATGDCVNIGVFYLRASAQLAVWFSYYIAWYYEHPYEIDQRGLNVFLRRPSELRVSYPPKNL